MPVSGRGPERRHQNEGAPDGRERRDLADRRGENNRLFVRFRVGATEYLLDVHEVQEIVASPQPVSVPLAPPAVAGLINLRGRIFAAVDLRALLGEPAGPPAALGIVISANGEAFVLLADEVHDVLEVSPTMFRQPPANFTGPARLLTRAVCQLPGVLLVLLEPGAVGREIDPTACPLPA